MPPRNALALQVPLNDEPVVEAIPDDIDACTEVYFEPSVADMIEEERCLLADPFHSDGTHLYLNRSMRCHKCGTLHPSVRQLGCGLA